MTGLPISSSFDRLSLRFPPNGGGEGDVRLVDRGA